MSRPFEARPDELKAKIEDHVDYVFRALTSDFLTIPKGNGFIEYPVFEDAYEHLKAATEGFRSLDREAVLTCALQKPLVLVVLRSIIGLSPPEWAHVATGRTGTVVTQSAVRSIDRGARLNPNAPLNSTGTTAERIGALVATACDLIDEGAPPVAEDRIHRLAKADTQSGLHGVQALADVGAPYAMLLYERFLGRPFASHRDSVSEWIGDVLENAIERELSAGGISYRKTKRAEKLQGFDQAPDFVIPDEFSPSVVIEAKVTEDDGTARDKVTRVQHLAAIAMEGGKRKFEVVACISGRGFSVRREDMKKLLLATEGKVFTLADLGALVGATNLNKYRSR